MIMPTFNFFLYLFLCALAYLFSLTYVGWFGGYLLWAVIIVPPLLALLSLPAMTSLRISCRVPERVNFGDKAEIVIKFSNRRLLPVRYCSFSINIVNLFTGEHYNFPLRYSLLDDSESMLTLPTSSSGTLLCSLEDEQLSSYLGLLRLRPKRQWQAKCTIMPKPKAPESMASLESLPPVSQNFRPKPGGGYSEEHELRQYRPGDNINSIHWKLSSKTDELIVREPLEPIESSTVVLLHTTGEIDLSHLYWLSLRLCSWNIEHVIRFGSVSAQVSNETDCRRAMLQLLALPRAKCPPISGNYGRVFDLENGEVRWH